MIVKDVETALKVSAFIAEVARAIRTSVYYLYGESLFGFVKSLIPFTSARAMSGNATSVIFCSLDRKPCPLEKSSRKTCTMILR